MSTNIIDVKVLQLEDGKNGYHCGHCGKELASNNYLLSLSLDNKNYIFMSKILVNCCDKEWRIPRYCATFSEAEKAANIIADAIEKGKTKTIMQNSFPMEELFPKFH